MNLYKITWRNIDSLNICVFICLCVCLYVFVCVYMCLCVFLCLCVFVCSCVVCFWTPYVFMGVKCVHVHRWLWVNLGVCTFECVWLSVFLYTSIIFKYTNKLIHLYTRYKVFFRPLRIPRLLSSFICKRVLLLMKILVFFRSERQRQVFNGDFRPNDGSNLTNPSPPPNKQPLFFKSK